MHPSDILTMGRFRLTLYGFYRLLRFTAAIDGPFARRLAEQDFSFVMSSKEERAARYYRVQSGRLTSRVTPEPTDFRLIWRDDRTGCRIMTHMVQGKPHALKNAVIRGDLLLEGEAALIGRFLEIINQMARVYRRRKRKKHA